MTSLGKQRVTPWPGIDCPGRFRVPLCKGTLVPEAGASEKQPQFSTPPFGTCRLDKTEAGPLPAEGRWYSPGCPSL